MKARVLILLMVCMGLMNKEIDMPNVMKDDVAVKSAVPAWMGRADKGGRENSSPVLGTKGGFGGVKAGGGVKQNLKGQPDWYQQEYQGYMQPTNAGDIRNPNVPVQALALDNKPATIQQRIKFGMPNLGTSDVNYQNQAQATPTPKTSVPAWMQPRPPAYGGMYNTTVTNPAYPSNPQTPNDVVPTDGQGQPVDTYDSYQGQPVDNSMSDLLRSMQPAYVMPPAWMNPTTNNPAFTMGRSYGGNWRPGGGGGGGGYGYGDAPAWANNEMGLFSWKVG